MVRSINFLWIISANPRGKDSLLYIYIWRLLNYLFIFYSKIINRNCSLIIAHPHEKSSCSSCPPLAHSPQKSSRSAMRVLVLLATPQKSSCSSCQPLVYLLYLPSISLSILLERVFILIVHHLPMTLKRVFLAFHVHAHLKAKYGGRYLKKNKSTSPKAIFWKQSSTLGPVCYHATILLPKSKPPWTTC